ncbi:MAG: amino acid permease [Caulobacteraceae bacterium]|nr:amino acid permease [Caulobacteraceae bacterium]
MAFWNRRKPIDNEEPLEEHHTLKRTLSWPHLVALGVGAIVGTGIYTLIGTGAGLAGPGVILSFVVAGVVCVCAALAYAEMATTIPASGSAYTYSYAVLGELLAWIVGWSLILEYTVVCSAVAVGWAGHANEFLHGLGVHLPTWLSTGWMADHRFGEAFAFDPAKGLVSLPAIFISVVVAALLAVGTRESATVNSLLVVLKIAALVLFVALALPHFDASHFQPFAPYGFAAHEEVRDGQTVKVGIMAAAAIIFFAFYGFDAVSTAAEECKNPGRDLTIGIVGSMIVCTILYMVIGAAALGAMTYTDFARSDAPLVHILQSLNQPQAGAIIAAAAVIALPTVILAFMYGQSRIFFVMARDGLLPRGMGTVSKKTGTPVVMTVFTAIVVSIIAGVFPLGEIASVANAGTLAAFIAVSAAMLVLRVREPNRPRVFKAPLPWLIGPVAIAGCIYLFTSLSHTAQMAFFVWNAIGLVAYFVYAMHASRLKGR